MEIRAYIGYNERTNTRYYEDFEVVDTLPAVGEDYELRMGDNEHVKSVCKVRLDCEQGNEEVWNYDYYEVEIEFTNFDNEQETFTIYLAKKIEEEN